MVSHVSTPGANEVFHWNIQDSSTTLIIESDIPKLQVSGQCEKFTIRILWTGVHSSLGHYAKFTNWGDIESNIPMCQCGRFAKIFANLSHIQGELL